MAADEFDIIRKLFAPLATSAAARGLVDDVALLDARGALVVTTDAIVEGAHFLADDPIETVAKKALRVNLSDLAAKGAKPVGVLLTLIWPRSRDAAQLAQFARGLGEDLQHYNVPLLGGDTTSTTGPLTVSITAFGEPLGARTPARADARAGEQVWITGVIGDGFLGLLSLTDMPEMEGAGVRARYWTPNPPVAFTPEIARFASASTDVSDGLIADAGNIARASGVAIRLDAEAIPLSQYGHAFVSCEGDAGLVKLVTGGDDYQALFTAPAEQRWEIVRAAKRAGVDVALIGDVEPGEGVRLVGGGGRVIDIPNAGHSHKLGR
ncbi:thiamine-phosphate kinase [Terricaulis sp.]|uniref:thiamine-phosphate kinase n=1 Tax=Terricaulis sp. TaxID=2768686 RepID=UPI00378399C1